MRVKANAEKRIAVILIACASVALSNKSMGSRQRKKEHETVFITFALEKLLTVLVFVGFAEFFAFAFSALVFFINCVLECVRMYFILFRGCFVINEAGFREPVINIDENTSHECNQRL